MLSAPSIDRHDQSLAATLAKAPQLWHRVSAFSDRAHQRQRRMGHFSLPTRPLRSLMVTFSTQFALNPSIFPLFQVGFFSQLRRRKQNHYTRAL
jgi:hypothetical protein